MLLWNQCLRSNQLVICLIQKESAKIKNNMWIYSVIQIAAELSEPLCSVARTMGIEGRFGCTVTSMGQFVLYLAFYNNTLILVTFTGVLKDRQENIAETCWLMWNIFMARAVCNTQWVTTGSEVKFQKKLKTLTQKTQ